MAAATVSGIQDAPAPESPDVKKVKTKTTRPILPPAAERKPIRTERLLIRPTAATDLEAIYPLRRQPEVMQWTTVGKPDKDLDVTREWLARFVPPNDMKTYQFAIIHLGEQQHGEEKDETTGELIGVGGVMRADDAGQPEVGYMFRTEYWGKGFATEFVRALLKAWWALPRREVEVETEVALVPVTAGKGEINVEGNVDLIRIPEVLIAVVVAENIGSLRVLEKSGFKEYKVWTEGDLREGYDGIVTLIGLKLEAPAS
jgi:RimJ/RimL family protein N-acetyltransferase